MELSGGGGEGRRRVQNEYRGSLPARRGTTDQATGVHELKVKSLFRFLASQPASFWFVCLYIFFEYVRPQSIYPAISGLPFAQVTLALSFGALVLERKLVRRMNKLDLALIFFGVVVVASITTAYDPGYSVSNLVSIVNWFLVYYLVTNLVDNEKRYLVFMFAFLLWSLKMAQHATRSWAASGFRFRGWGVTGAPGWFHNSGEFAIQMTIYVPLAIYFILSLRKYWPTWKTWLMWLMPVSGVIGVLGSSSRGGQLGIGAVIVVMAAKSRRRVRALTALALVAVAGWIMLPDAQKERWMNAGDDQTSQARYNYWEDGIDIMNEFPVLGVGFDNWLPFYRNAYQDDDPGGLSHTQQLPHNIFVEAGAELGYTGLLAFLLLIGATFYLNNRTRRLAPRCRGDPDFFRYMAHGLDAALVGYLVSGFFVTVLYYPYFWVNLAMTSALYSVAASQAMPAPRKSSAPARSGRPARRRARSRPGEI